jgi:hypothetical protein
MRDGAAGGGDPPGTATGAGRPAPGDPRPPYAPPGPALYDGAWSLVVCARSPESSPGLPVVF